MDQAWVQGVTVVAAVGSVVVGGVFFAFSNFVMAGLRRTGAEAGSASMQSINVTVLNPWFLGLFAGTGLASAVLLVPQVAALDSTSGRIGLAASLSYIVGVFVVTGAYNVPRNNRLAAMEGSRAQEYWPEYDRQWSRANHVRTAFGVAAGALYVLSALTA